MSADMYCTCGKRGCMQCHGPIAAQWAKPEIAPFTFSDRHGTPEYQVSVLGVQVGEATEETLNFLHRHYSLDQELMCAVVGEFNRRRRLE
jgi:hypothetical protein